MAKPLLLNLQNWQVITLEPKKGSGFIERVESGGTPKTTNDEFWDGDVLWLTPKEITRNGSGLFVSDTERKITELGVKKSSAKIMPKGTVMLTKRAPVGAVAIAAESICSNQGFLNFVCGGKLIPAYLAEWFKINKPYLDAVANGSTYAELYKTDLFEFHMCIPPLKEQEHILNVISCIRRLINSFEMIERSSVNFDKVSEIQSRKRKLEKLEKEISPILLSGGIKNLANLLTTIE
jgi:restriction endonuclease S subunit